ncbi:retrotransposon protein, putative, ty1-copia subclass [Tanacetum coccineum]
MGLRGIQKLNKGALDLYIGNGNCAAVEAKGSFDLILPSGMMVRKPFTHASERADDLLRLIHSDVCGPFRITSREGANYYVTITNDFNRYGYVYLIKHKHEVFEMLKTFQNEVENQLGKTIKTLRSNQGGEYLSQEFLDHLRSRGIISQLTPPYTPQHNGVFKRINLTLLDMVRSMMSLMTLPMSFWGYALKSVARILNMVPTKKVNKAPYEIWHEKVLNLSYLKVWGCEALIKRDMTNKHESRSIKCIFVGYLKEIMGYNSYYPPENKICVARYDEFFKNNLISHEASGNTVDFDEIQREDAQPSENTSKHQPEVEHEDFEPLTDVIPVRRPARIPQAPKRYGFYVDAEEHELGDHGEPPNYRPALSDPKFNKWLEAINAKMQSIKDNQMDASICGSIPMQPNVDLSKTQGPSTPAEVKQMKEVPYIRLQVLSYMLLVYGGDSSIELNVTCYTDVGWETDRDDLRSQMRYIFVMNRGAVDLKSSKQSTTAMSSTEVEYITASKAAMESNLDT